MTNPSSLPSTLTARSGPRDRSPWLWRSLLGACALSALGTLGACSTVDSASRTIAYSVSPYRPEVVQGNVVTREQVQLLRTGLTRNQVRQLLGTPLVSSVFHANRWDYVFTINRLGTPPQRRHLSLVFKDDLLDSFNGDEMPGETEFITSITRVSSAKSERPLKASPQELERFLQDNPVQPAALGGPVTETPASYPPLESGTRP